MRIYVMCDLEGVAGVVSHEKQCFFTGEHYPQARRLATLELNALVEGVLAAGGDEVVAWDGHGSFPGGLDVELLHPACRLVMGTGDGGPEALDGSFQAAMQLGMHAMAGTPSPLAHSFMLHYRRLELNGLEFGELAMNCLTAGELGVPTIMLAGDYAATQEALQLVPNMETVAVKHGFSSSGCVSLAPERARQLIREGAERAVRRLHEIKPFFIEPPYTLKVEYRAEKFAQDLVRRCPRARLLTNCSVELQADRLSDLMF